MGQHSTKELNSFTKQYATVMAILFEETSGKKEYLQALIDN